jgi:hypothetical protein
VLCKHEVVGSIPSGSTRRLGRRRTRARISNESFARILGANGREGRGGLFNIVKRECIRFWPGASMVAVGPSGPGGSARGSGDVACHGDQLDRGLSSGAFEAKNGL